MNHLARIRMQFAQQVARHAGIVDERIISAFSTIQREMFLGPGPWQLSESGDMSPSNEPENVYQDRVIALSSSQGITNGQPSLHARCLHEIVPKPGEQAIHIGAGSGYYTAVVAELVGPLGRVAAFEVDTALARRAVANLQKWPNVTVRSESATNALLGPADIIYVNAGVSSPPQNWLDALNPGGRLLFPLVPGKVEEGAMLMLTRKPTGFAARFIISAKFYPCIGACDPVLGLAEAFRRGDMERVQAFINDRPPDQTCWYSVNGWWLSTALIDG